MRLGPADELVPAALGAELEPYRSSDGPAKVPWEVIPWELAVGVGNMVG